MSTLTRSARAAVLALAVTAAPAAAQQTLTFDDLPFQSVVGNQYAARGITFGAGDFGVMEGLANGDLGNWGVNGTNGPYFLGFNGSPSYGITATFAAPTNGFALDVSRTNGSSPNDQFTLEWYQGATLVGSTTITFQNVNTWTRVATTASALTSVRWYSTGPGFRPYGVDNVIFGDGTSVVPEPATITLLAGGLAATLVGARRRRRA